MRRCRRSTLCVGVVTCAIALGVWDLAAGRGSGARAGTTTEYRFVQYPDAGFGGIDGQIARAHRTIDMEMYELADPVVEHDLISAAARGVHVRVLLDRAFTGAEVNSVSFHELASHGVAVRWAPAGYIFHIKATSFDAATTDISTANLTSKYYATTRDAEIVDRNPAQVHGVEQTFANDWAGGGAGTPRAQTVQAPGLVWSPNTGSGTAETALVAEIAGAHGAIDFESEELADPAIVDALATDARRGIRCRIVMTRSSDWDSAFATVTRAGCRVHLFPDNSTALYIHEKLILVDPASAGESMLLGSQNASVTSLTHNRELGIVLRRAGGGDAAIIAATATFDTDFGKATPWSQTQAPPAPSPSPGPARAGCHPRTSTGNCYEAGEYCSEAEHGTSGIAGDGEAIVCENRGGWRWEAR